VYDPDPRTPVPESVLVEDVLVDVVVVMLAAGAWTNPAIVAFDANPAEAIPPMVW
jgi:hypothetical protein